MKTLFLTLFFLATLALSAWWEAPTGVALASAQAGKLSTQLNNTFFSVAFAPPQPKAGANSSLYSFDANPHKLSGGFQSGYTSDEEFKKDLAAVANDNMWAILLKVKYRVQKNQYIPEFTPEVKALDNTYVTLKGYMYPLEEKEEQEFFILSYYPIAQCFFCGGAGPESVVEINAKTPIAMNYKAIQVKGRLRLNADDPDRLFFILFDAEEVQ